MRRAQVSVPGVGYSMCHVFDDRTPLLEVTSEAAVVTLSPAEAGSITGQEVAFAWQLASNAERYAQQCVRFVERIADRAGEGLPDTPV